MNMYATVGKRFMDLATSLIVIIVSSPFFLLVTFILAWVNQGKVFFKQSRPGWREQPFTLLKFKTMSDARDPAGNLLPDKLRLTRVGAFIRKTSLDELPQLINVVKGEMSLVGPRPLLFKYIPLYNNEQRRRHEVRPGITGWAQVNGRNSISWNQKFDYDLYYVDNLSLLLDLKIIWMTIRKVLRQEGINQSAERPMEPFTGNN